MSRAALLGVLLATCAGCAATACGPSAEAGSTAEGGRDGTELSPVATSVPALRAVATWRGAPGAGEAEEPGATGEAAAARDAGAPGAPGAPRGAGAPGPAGEADGAAVELHRATWIRNGRLAPEGEPGVAGDGVRLPFDATGVRWATVFETGAEGMVRLALHWRPGPDGILYEIVLDGRRLSPPRDGWRPTPRAVVTDLGPAWLGTGRHLLELVAREDVAGAVEIRRLSWERQPLR